jgi:Tfp pilus assembly protein PilO
VTTRDRLIIVVVLVAAALAGFWFLGLAPKRKDAADLQAQIDTTTQQLAAAQAKAAQATQARAHYDKDYATVATLGKAVPKSDAIPSLMYQLQSAAHNARIDFRSLKLSAAGGQGPAATTPAASATATAKGSSGGASSSSSSSSSSSTPPATSSTPAPATQASAATLPPGAAVGDAGFPTMPFSFVFNGSFFDMESFMREVNRLVRVDGQHIDVRGRLLSIDGFALMAGPGGFPAVKASISATAYLQSPDDTVAAPAADAATSGGAATPSSSGATASEVAR